MMIKSIDINLIDNHPLNPRKDLGDLTELADSIKETGILQNLTIVEQPENPGKYWTVIGNRRLAASKLAGLKEVPCAVSTMDHKTQLSTMLLENMQRVDLTAFEQAQGFQMMLDVGETLEDISQKTGFSESTVRRRVKLLELDQGTLKEVSGRQPNLTDFMELEKIKDITMRNEVLESIGTADFNNNLERALSDQKSKEAKEKILQMMDDNGAIEVKDRDTWEKTYIGQYPISEESIEKIKELDSYEFYIIYSWGISLYKTKEEKELTEEEIQEQKAREEKRKLEEKIDLQVKEIKERTEKLRKDFIDSLPETKIKNHFNELVKLMFTTNLSLHLWGDDYKDIWELEGENIEELAFDIAGNNPYTSLLKTMYIKEFKYSSYFNFRNEFCEDKELDLLYEFIEGLGYQMSEEEKRLQNGSHEIFKEV